MYQTKTHCKIKYAWSCHRLHNCCGEWKGLDPVNRFIQTSWVAVVTRTYCTMSVRNRWVIQANQKCRRMFKTHKSGNKKISGEIGLNRSKCPLLACRTRCKCSMENSVIRYRSVVFGSSFVLSLCILEFVVGVMTFVIGWSQISSSFSSSYDAKRELKVYFF